MRVMLSTKKNIKEQLTKSGAGLIVPNVFTLSNIKSGSLDYGSYGLRKAIYSLYGLVNIGFKDMIFLVITA
jgi:hypothetical protein